MSENMFFIANHFELITKCDTIEFWNKPSNQLINIDKLVHVSCFQLVLRSIILALENRIYCFPFLPVFVMNNDCIANVVIRFLIAYKHNDFKRNADFLVTANIHVKTMYKVTKRQQQQDLKKHAKQMVTFAWIDLSVYVERKNDVKRESENERINE